MLICQRCGSEYPPLEGRGRQSKLCPDCRARHRRAMSGIRQLRHTNTTVNEWIEALGPLILQWKEDLAEKQNHRCLRCGRGRKLYFAVPPDLINPTVDQMIGLCSACHADWTIERRKRT